MVCKLKFMLSMLISELLFPMVEFYTKAMKFIHLVKAIHFCLICCAFLWKSLKVIDLKNENEKCNISFI